MSVEALIIAIALILCVSLAVMAYIVMTEFWIGVFNWMYGLLRRCKNGKKE